MDSRQDPVRRVVSPAFTSRLPAKKNSYHSLRTAASEQQPPTTRTIRQMTASPGVMADISDFTFAAPALPNGFSRRFSTTHSAEHHTSVEDQLSNNTTPGQGLTARGHVAAPLAASSSTGRTRIPRPSLSPTPGQQPQPPPQNPTRNASVLPTPRRPMSVTDAYRMAEDEDAISAAAQGSPSPAPRPWRSGNNATNISSATKHKSKPSTPLAVTAAAVAIASAGAGSISASESRMERILAQSPLSFGGRRTARRLGEHQPQALQKRDDKNGSRTSPVPPGPQSADMMRIRYEEDQVRMEVAKSERNGLFSPKARVIPKPAAIPRPIPTPKSSTSSRDRSRRSSIASPTPPSPSPSPNGGVPPASAAPTPPSSSGRQWGVRSRQGSFLKRMLSGSGRGSSEALHSQPASIAASLPPEQPLPRVLPPSEPTVIPASPSPTKNHAWDADVDMDFTARDLMVSDSPPVRVRTAEQPATSGSQFNEGAAHPEAERPQTSPSVMSPNLKLDKIRQLEVEVDRKFPVGAAQTADHHQHQQYTSREVPFSVAPPEVSPEVSPNLDADSFKGPLSTMSEDSSEESDEHSHNSSAVSERTNKKIDEIRAREIETLSKRALATARLDEIRERNAGYRAPSRESMGQRASQEQLRTVEEAAAETGVVAEGYGRPEGAGNFLDVEGKHVAKTTGSVLRAKSQDRSQAGGEDGKRVEVDGLRKLSPLSSQSVQSVHSRNESQELLRSLARVTTLTSPTGSGPGKEHSKELQPALKNTRRLREIKSVSSLRGDGGLETDTLRPSVGFAGMRRMSSGDTVAKRSSVAISEGDALDRIEAEMRLFAPGENHSEKGSIRAPSPLDEQATAAIAAIVNGGAKSNGDKVLADDATPRARKIIDPLMQPTPRVTGAYVETPMTTRTERMQEMVEEAEKQQPVGYMASLFRKRASSTVSSKNGSVVTSSVSASELRQRSRSLPRAERRPVINSAKPPSAHDDLLEIKQAQQADDPTLDNFDELLRRHASQRGPEAEEGDRNTVTPERLRRMTSSVTASLLDLQRARSGIEGLSDRVLQEKMITEVGGRENGTAKEEVEEEEEEEEMVEKVENEEKEKEKEEEEAEMVKKMEKEAKEADKEAIVPTIQHRRQSVGSKLEKAVVQSDASEKKEVVGSGVEVKIEAPDSRVEVKKEVLRPEVEEVKKEVAPQATVLKTTDGATYVRISLPRLFRQGQLTLVGMLVAMVAVWLAMEGTVCALYCRPEVCAGSAKMCEWSPDDPSFGAALPVKLDQWLAGGRGRTLASWTGEELGDWAADVWDTITGTDIRLVDPTYFSFDEKRRHRRRLQKHGLVAPWTAPEEARARLEEWRQAREARERAREEGRDLDDDEAVEVESMPDDEHAGWW